MARIAQSKELKQLKGTGNQTREAARAEPSYPDGCLMASYNEETEEVTYPMPPNDLSEKAKQLWNRNAYQLAKMRLFPNSAYEYLHNYCRLYDIAEKAFEEYGGSVTLMNDKGEVRPNPALKIFNDTISQLALIGSKFAFTPADKTKVNMKVIEGSALEKNSKKKPSLGG